MQHVFAGVPLIALCKQQMRLIDEYDIGLAAWFIWNASTIFRLFTEFVDELGRFERYFVGTLLQS